MRFVSSFFCALMLFMPATVFAAEPGMNHKWDKLADISAQALHLTQQEKYEEAKQMLDYFEKVFTDKNHQSSGLPMANLRVLTTTYELAKRSVTSVSEEAEARKQNVMRFHLVVDALNANKQPLWKSTEQQVMEPLHALKKTAQAKDERQFQRRLNEFLKAYELIHPALVVDLSMAEMGRIDSEIQYLIHYRTHFFNQPNAMEHLQRIESDFVALFNGTLKDQMEPTLPWVMLTIGGMIVVTLFYSGWKKYRAEKKARKKRKEKADHRSRF
ncbi:MAG TPA: sporulation protein YpjB [Bacillales bacterium]|nr:sporulation protein YpjB [Bacillales bacterium]